MKRPGNKKPHNSKLSPQQRRNIIRAILNGASNYSQAKAYGVSRQYVGRLMKGVDK